MKKRHVWVMNEIDLTFDLSRSLKVKCDVTSGLPIYDILLIFYSSIGPNSASLRDIILRNFGDLDLDLSRPPKVKCDGAILLPICGFLFMFNSNIWPNYGLL